MWSSGWPVGNAQPAAADRYDGPPFQRGTMSVEDLRHQRNALRGRDVGKPHEPRMRQVVEVDQLTEIRVHGDQDAALFRARASSARSPGSGPSSRASTTSCPWSRNQVASRRPAQRSARNLKPA